MLNLQHNPWVGSYSELCKALGLQSVLVLYPYKFHLYIEITIVNYLDLASMKMPYFPHCFVLTYLEMSSKKKVSFLEMSYGAFRPHTSSNTPNAWTFTYMHF